MIDFKKLFFIGSGFVISRKSMQSLAKYLQDHESSIADGENDFGELKEIYEELFHRKANGL